LTYRQGFCTSGSDVDAYYVLAHRIFSVNIKEKGIYFRRPFGLGLIRKNI
jgi:hypothetical protein